MTKINDGGPAFPSGSVSVGDGDTQAFAPGMSLRDWFAGQAPVTFEMAVQAAYISGPVRKADRQAVWRAMADLRLEYADAMIAARKGGEQ